MTNNHCEVHGELVRCMELSAKEGEISELGYNGISIKYDGISIDQGNGCSVIALYRDGVEDITTGSEVASIPLKDDKEYEVKECSGKGYYPELIEK